MIDNSVKNRNVDLASYGALIVLSPSYDIDGIIYYLVKTSETFILDILTFSIGVSNHDLNYGSLTRISDAYIPSLGITRSQYMQPVMAVVFGNLFGACV